MRPPTSPPNQQGNTMTAYASFGGTFTPSPEFNATEEACYEAGRRWAQKGNTKLPVHTLVAGRDIQIVRSSHEWAKAFVSGWKAAGKGTRPVL
jgi:hypothetical protein